MTPCTGCSQSGCGSRFKKIILFFLCQVFLNMSLLHLFYHKQHSQKYFFHVTISRDAPDLRHVSELLLQSGKGKKKKKGPAPGRTRTHVLAPAACALLLCYHSAHSRSRQDNQTKLTGKSRHCLQQTFPIFYSFHFFSSETFFP